MVLLALVAAGCVVDLGTLAGGDYANATDINGRGVTVGHSNDTAGGVFHAFRREPGGRWST